MIDPALEPPRLLVSEKYRVRERYHTATYHKVSRFTPGRGVGRATISVHPFEITAIYTTIHVVSVRLSSPVSLVKMFSAWVTAA